MGSLELAPEKGHGVIMELDHTTYPRMHYADRKGLDLTGNVYCGQLKALCMDVQFLTAHSSTGDLVVYIAGRDGGHLPTLSRMFPCLRFDVFDLPQANPLLLGETCPKFNFINRKFNEQDAAGYRSMMQTQGKEVLLISDMRPVDIEAKCAVSSDVTQHTLFVNDQDEMNVQMRWVQTMRPRQALIRFRVPYNETDGELGQRVAPEQPMTITYLKGKMFFQPFCKRTSTEASVRIRPLALILFLPLSTFPFPLSRASYFLCTEPLCDAAGEDARRPCEPGDRGLRHQGLQLQGPRRVHAVPQRGGPPLPL